MCSLRSLWPAHSHCIHSQTKFILFYSVVVKAATVASQKRLLCTTLGNRTRLFRFSLNSSAQTSTQNAPPENVTLSKSNAFTGVKGDRLRQWQSQTLTLFLEIPLRSPSEGTFGQMGARQRHGACVISALGCALHLCQRFSKTSQKTLTTLSPPGFTLPSVIFTVTPDRLMFIESSLHRLSSHISLKRAGQAEPRFVIQWLHGANSKGLKTLGEDECWQQTAAGQANDTSWLLGIWQTRNIARRTGHRTLWWPTAGHYALHWFCRA